MSGEMRNGFGFRVIALFAVCVCLAFASFASLANATVYAASGASELSIKVGDAVIVDSHKLVLKDVSSAPYGTNYAATAVFDVFDAQGTKVNTVSLDAASATKYSAPTFSVKIESIAPQTSATPAEAKIIVATPVTAVTAIAVTPVARRAEATLPASEGAAGGGASQPVRSSDKDEAAAGAGSAGGAGKPAGDAGVTKTFVSPMGVEASEAGIAQVIASGKSEFAIKLRKGWNMVSTPFVGASLKTTCSRSKLWNYNAFTAKYDSPGLLGEAVLEQGKGYWVNAASDCGIVLEFANDFDGADDNHYSNYLLEGLPLRAGWNQIGGTSEVTPLKEIAGDCEVRSAWGFNAPAQRYVKASALKPGEAYFVNVAHDCVFGSTEPAIPGLPAEETDSASSSDSSKTKTETAENDVAVD